MFSQDGMYRHRKGNVSHKVRHNKIDHVVYKRMHLDHLTDDMRHLLQQGLGLIGTRRVGSQRKSRRIFDKLNKSLGGRLGILGRYDGADNGHSIQGLIRRLRLIDYSLHVGVIDATNCNSAYGGIFDGFQNGFRACCSDD